MPEDEITPERHARAHEMQMAVLRFGMFLAGSVVFTAMYGPKEYSERAFRIMHWWKRDPEPEPSAV